MTNAEIEKDILLLKEAVRNLAIFHDPSGKGGDRLLNKVNHALDRMAAGLPASSLEPTRLK